MEKSRAFQKRFFETILTQIPLNQLAAAMSEILDKSKQDCYRRISGKYAISIDEVSILMAGLRDKYRMEVSIDGLVFEGKQNVVFSFNAFSQPIKQFEDFLSQILQNVKMAQALPGVKIYYGSNEIPLTLYCLAPKILSFKLFLYGITQWDFDYLERLKYTHQLISPETIALGNEIAKAYVAIPSFEIWNETIIDNTLHQISYMSATNKIRTLDEAIELCDEVKKLIRHFEKMVDYGQKFPIRSSNGQPGGGKFNIYLNHLANVNDSIMCTSDQANVFFTALSTPNFLITQNAKMCTYIKEKFDHIIRKSTELNSNPVERTQYFNRLEKKIENTKEWIALRATAP